MEGLRPDRDEVDSFQRNRKSGGKKSSSAPEAKTSSELKPNKKRPVVAKEAKSGSSIAVWIMMAVIAGAVSWFGWEGYKQQQSLKDMHTELNDALVFLRQSKLLMARLEGELSETGAELEESGTDAQKKLKFLDSEVRKLWGVAYDRNRKSIAVNDGAIKQQDKTLKQQASLLKDIDKTLKQEVKGLTELTTKTEKLCMQQLEWQ